MVMLTHNLAPSRRTNTTSFTVIRVIALKEPTQCSAWATDLYHLLGRVQVDKLCLQTDWCLKE